MAKPALTRRHFLKMTAATGTVAAGWVPFGAKMARAQSSASILANTKLHGLSAFGELKYAADFKHFDYVNPQALKGGNFTFSPSSWMLNQNPNNFNSFNSYILRGDAPPRMELCFDQLMVASLDEPDSLYCLIAETVTISEDHNQLTFQLRPQARFHDGSPLTADDVVFSYQILKEYGHPALKLALSELKELHINDTHNLTLRFSGKQTLPAVLGALTMPIFSARWYNEHEFDQSSLIPPLGSGAYKVGNFNAGEFVTYDYVEDYWAKDLPVMQGQNNFSHIRIEFYRDRQPEFEAFKKGEIEWRSESVAKNWATEYNFPAVQQKRVIKRNFTREKTPVMQAWALNQRRENFKDVRVREAIGLCFDFEWTNKNIFYNLYTRLQSCFGGSDFEAHGTPSVEEMEIIRSFQGRLPAAIEQEPIVLAVSNGSGRDRRLLSQAVKLLTEAGFTRKDGLLKNANGEDFNLEILSNSISLNRVYEPFSQRLRSIGINATLRLVDPIQYQKRLQDFDFDLVGIALRFSPTPTAQSLGNMFSTHSASTNGSYNLPGVEDPLLDEMIEKIGQVTNRQSLITHMRVLDRYLRLRRDWIPNWYQPYHLAAYWDKFDFKEPKPDYGFPVETLWWKKDTNS